MVRQARHGGAKMGFSGVPELRDQRMPLERLLHDPALDPLAAAVYEADFAETRFMGCAHVLFHDRLDIPRRERVQIQVIFNRNAVGHFKSGRSL